MKMNSRVCASINLTVLLSCCLQIFPLPAFGVPETPEQMYMRYRKKLMEPSSSLVEILPYLSKEGQKKMRDPKFDQNSLDMIRSFSPREVKIKKSLIDGQKAKVFLQADSMPNPLGTSSAEQENSGTAYFSFEDGLWKLDRESWKSKNRKEPAPHPEWVLKAATADFPRKAAAGKIKGTVFKVDKATIEGDTLVLRQGTDFFADRAVEIWFHDSELKLEDRTFIIEEDSDLHGPQLFLKWKNPGGTLPESQQFYADDGASMRLQFMKRNGAGKIPVWIVLRFPDHDESFVEGYVEAELLAR